MSELHQETILKELASCEDEASIQAFHATYLGKKGLISAQFKTLKDLPDEQKKIKWQEITVLSGAIETAFFAKQDQILQAVWDEKLAQEYIDITTPGITPPVGHLTLLSETRRNVEQIFQGMWFHIDYGHDMVTQYENFTSVNIPPTHPATEMHDTLYLEQNDQEWQKLLMRTHTSAHQVAMIKKLWVPCKFVIPGKVYRFENLDASHDTVFWQIEGVVIDKNISIAHFKQMMSQILSAILEQDNTEIRLRPAYFPFVEPGFEIDAKAVVGKHEKWLEILGAGMIHPHVLREAWIDPNKYSGFAFGMGMTRLVAVKYGLHDVRLLTNGDLRFIKSY